MLVEISCCRRTEDGRRQVITAAVTGLAVLMFEMNRTQRAKDTKRHSNNDDEDDDEG